MTMSRRRFLAGCGCMAASHLLLPNDVLAVAPMTFENKICAFGGSRAMGRVTNLGKPAPEAVKMVRWMTDIVGIRQNIKVVAADIERYVKAFATIKNRQRYIVYNRADFDWKDGRTSFDDLTTMGHEVGHHVPSHVMTQELSEHEEELEADRFSGFIMSKLGATLEQATKKFWDWPATEWHPGGLRRKQAVADGWHHGEKMKLAQSAKCSPGFTGDEINIDGTICRMTRVCEGRQAVSRLACKDYEGIWRWKR